MTLCNPMDYSPPGSSVHGIRKSFPSPKDLADPEIKPASPTPPALAGGFSTASAICKARADRARRCRRSCGNRERGEGTSQKQRWMGHPKGGHAGWLPRCSETEGLVCEALGPWQCQESTHPACPAPTHHLEDPEEGHEVAGLRGLQLEEVHGDDGEHDHEEPWAGGGQGSEVRAVQPCLSTPLTVDSPGHQGPAHGDQLRKDQREPSPRSSLAGLPHGATMGCEQEGARSCPCPRWADPKAVWRGEGMGDRGARACTVGGFGSRTEVDDLGSHHRAPLSVLGAGELGGAPRMVRAEHFCRGGVNPLAPTWERLSTCERGLTVVLCKAPWVEDPRHRLGGVAPGPDCSGVSPGPREGMQG